MSETSIPPQEQPKLSRAEQLRQTNAPPAGGFFERLERLDQKKKVVGTTAAPVVNPPSPTVPVQTPPAALEAARALPVASLIPVESIQAKVPSSTPAGISKDLIAESAPAVEAFRRENKTLADFVREYKVRQGGRRDHATVSLEAYQRINEFAILANLTITAVATYLLDRLPKPTRIVPLKNAAMVSVRPLLAEDFDLPTWLADSERTGINEVKEHQVGFFRDEYLHSKIAECRLRGVAINELLDAAIIRYLPPATKNYPVKKRRL